MMAGRKITVSFTAREARVAFDALTHLSAYTGEEMEEHLAWGAADRRAWSSAAGKLSTAAQDADLSEKAAA